jgi:hypothetical protein
LRYAARIAELDMAEIVAVADESQAMDATAHSALSASELSRLIMHKRHSQAVLCLARRRLNVLWAMQRDSTSYQPGLPRAA